MKDRRRGEPSIGWQAKPNLNAPNHYPVHDIFVGPNGRVSGHGGSDTDPLGRPPVNPRSTRKSARNGNMR
jgi:hypothetical protein